MTTDNSYYNDGICPICDKPYLYVGDIPEGGFQKGQEPYCTCHQNQTNVTFYQYGWICPKCGKANAPHINQCNCQSNIYPWSITWW